MKIFPDTKTRRIIKGKKIMQDSLMLLPTVLIAMWIFRQKSGCACETQTPILEQSTSPDPCIPDQKNNLLRRKDPATGMLLHLKKNLTAGKKA